MFALWVARQHLAAAGIVDGGVVPSAAGEHGSYNGTFNSYSPTDVVDNNTKTIVLVAAFTITMRRVIVGKIVVMTTRVTATKYGRDGDNSSNSNHDNDDNNGNCIVLITMMMKIVIITITRILRAKLNTKGRKLSKNGGAEYCRKWK